MEEEAEKVKKTCPVCGKEFETNRSNKKYCSFACAGEARYVQSLKYTNQRRKEDPEFRERLLETARRSRKKKEPAERKYKNCIICGAEIPESRSKRAKTCSDECSKVNSYNIQMAWHEKHPNGAYGGRKKKVEVEDTRDDTKAIVINEVCGVPCSQCELDYCPYE